MKNIKGLTIALFFTMIAAGASASATTKPVVQDWVLPNATLTPGALNPAVTQANIKDNVCKANWTGTVRPTVAYTNKLKTTQMAGGYKYLQATFGTAASAYEEDHLISLQLGGNPTDPKNLWPEPYAGNNARKKDVVESALKRLVCAGTMKLVDAQKAILNWPVAYKQYVTAKDTADTSDN